MYLSRRGFLGALMVGTASITTGYPSLVRAQTQSGRAKPFPAAQDLMPGDFVWPKKPDTYIPYNSGRDADYDQEKRDWEEEKRKFIENIRKNPDSPRQLRELATRLENMEFREFLAQYQGDERPGIPESYGAGFPLYVGHVGIVFLDGNIVSIVEALWGKGVKTSAYEDWLHNRPGELVWQGRVRDYRNPERARIADVALTFKDKPYDFWNFDLSDESGFYCSKLVWLSVMKALTLAVDGNPDPKRLFWFSPKQLMKADAVYMLNNPGSYGYPLPTGS